MTCALGAQDGLWARTESHREMRVENLEARFRFSVFSDSASPGVDLRAMGLCKRLIQDLGLWD